MSAYVLKILETDFVTHDVKRFVIEKPDHYSFIPGQGTDVAINVPEWKEQFRPFTFTSLNEWPHLEFTVKLYMQREGVTRQLARLNPGAELIIKEPYGNITYKGPGVFIAAGSGITPFIAIFRELNKKKQLSENTLVYTNRTSGDVIYDQELTRMLGKHMIKVFTREHTIGFIERRIDRNFIVDHVRDFSKPFYVCGPDEFVKRIIEILLELGASAETLVFQD